MADDDHSVISGHLKKQLKRDYEQSLFGIVNEEKKKVIKRWSTRADFEAMLMMVGQNKDGELVLDDMNTPAGISPQQEAVSDEHEHENEMAAYHQDLE